MSQTHTEGSTSTPSQTPSSTTTKSPASTQTSFSPPDTASARAAVHASLAAVGSTYDADLQRRVADLHSNSKAIATQEKNLVKATAALNKESAKWAKMVDKTTKQLNEFGDVQNWAEVLERDLLVLEETVRLVEGREDEGNASGVNRMA
jgi:ABC-type transporter Mla subunit MlaD